MSLRTRSENGRGRSRVGRDEQCEARPGNSAPRGGPQLELSRRQLETWSESEPSAALVQPFNNPPCIYMFWLHAGMRYPKGSQQDRCFFRYAHTWYYVSHITLFGTMYEDRFVLILNLHGPYISGLIVIAPGTMYINYSSSTG